MAGSFDRLMLTVGLLDKITGPMRGIQRTIQQVTSNSRKAFMNTAAGVTALIAASASFANTVNPANDMNMALGEVRSMDVADDTLKRLNQAGLQYSIKFGESASNYVRSAYDIQSAIDGLEGADLPKFTTAAGTLAKATKANVADITSYFGSMYGIFREQANGMGKSSWVEMLAGQTATAVQMFKTTGPEMKSAFESIGAGATEMGVKINEQMAVLGTLQSTMSGSEAGTKYGAFLEGLSGAQAEFGLNFSDANGDLLPIVEIMQKIKGEMGGMGWDQSRDFLSGAFNDEAIDFIQLMGKDVNKLGSDINKLGDITGMEKAGWMAAQMQNNFARLAQSVTAISIAIWQKALPSIEPYINMMTTAASVIVKWTDKYPHLTKAFGLAITAFIAFVAIAGVMSIAIGMARFAMVGFTMRFIVVRPIIWGVVLVGKAWVATLWLMRTALLAFVLYGPAMSAFFLAMKTGLLTALPAIWSFTAALLANPIVLIVLGLWALGAALVALVVYWDDVTAAISKFFSFVASGFVDLWNAVAGFFGSIPSMLSDLKSWFAGVDWLDLLAKGVVALVGGIVGLVSGMLGLIWSAITGFVGLVWSAIAGVFGFIGKAWQAVRGSFEDNDWMKVIFSPIYGAVLLVDNVIAAFEKIPQWWGDFQVWLGSVSLTPSWDLSIDAFESIKTWWTDFKGWLSALDPFAFLGEKVDWLKSKMSWLPGIDASTSASSTQEVISKVESQAESVNKSVVLPGAESSQSGGESGGLFQTISNMFGGSKKSVHVEKMEVNNHGQGVRGDDLMYQLEMEAG